MQAEFSYQNEHILILMNDGHVSPPVPPDDGEESEGQFIIHRTQLEIELKPLSVGKFRRR